MRLRVIIMNQINIYVHVYITALVLWNDMKIDMTCKLKSELAIIMIIYLKRHAQG